MSEINVNTQHIQILNLCGQGWDSHRGAVAQAIRTLPSPLTTQQDQEKLGMCIDGQPVVNKCELKEPLYDEFLRNVSARFQSLSWVVLIEEDPDLNEENGINEPLGHYTPDARGSKALLAALDRANSKEGGWIVDRQPYDDFRTAIDAGKQRSSAVPVVALIMPNICRFQEKWSADVVLQPLVDSLSPDIAKYWLTTKVLHHEIGHHIFSLVAEVDDENNNEYNKYANGDMEVVRLAEAGANFYSWLIGSDNDRAILDGVTQLQDSSYRAYSELLTFAESRQRLTVGLFLATVFAFEPDNATRFGGVTWNESYQRKVFGANFVSWPDVDPAWTQWKQANYLKLEAEKLLEQALGARPDWFRTSNGDRLEAFRLRRQGNDILVEINDDQSGV